MQIIRSSLAPAMLAASLVAAASPLAAQQRALFDWTGIVDRETQIVMRGNDLRTRNTGPSDRPDRAPRVVGFLPRADGIITVQLLDGRGRADVIQQPDRVNDYTAIIRVRDVRTGSGRYRIAAYWESLEDEDDWPNRGRANGNGTWDDPASRTATVGVESRPRTYPRTDGFQTALQWRGMVDDEVELRIQGDRVEARTIRGGQVQVLGSHLYGTGLPRRVVDVRVDRNQGRGTIELVEQPSARNGYTTVIRITDRAGGAGQYDLDVNWR